MKEEKVITQHIVIFDGVCHLCHRAVNFIIKRDKHDTFVFTAIQSPTAQALIKQYKLEYLGMDSFILIKENRCFVRTTAALEITKDLSGLWCLLNVFKVFPSRFRDYFYDVLAKNRYRIFGKSETCLIPTARIKNKFLD